MPAVRLELQTVPATLVHPDVELIPPMEVPYQRVVHIASVVGEAACKYTGSDQPTSTTIELDEPMAASLTDFARKNLANYEPGVDPLSKDYLCYDFACQLAGGQSQGASDALGFLLDKHYDTERTPAVPENVWLPNGAMGAVLDERTGMLKHEFIALGTQDERTLQALNQGGHIGLVTYGQMRDYFKNVYTWGYYYQRVDPELRLLFLPPELQPTDMQGNFADFRKEWVNSLTPGRR